MSREDRRYLAACFALLLVGAAMMTIGLLGEAGVL